MFSCTRRAAVLCAVLYSTAATATTKQPTNGWVSTGERADNAAHEVTFALRAQDPEALGIAFERISNPDSPSFFRNFLDHAGVAKLVKPLPDAVASIQAWAKDVDASVTFESSVHGDLLFLKAESAVVERLFDVALFTHTHPQSNHTVARVDAAIDPVGLLPAHLKAVVTGVFGLSELSPIPDRPKLSAYGAEPGIQIDPDVLAKTYAFGSTVGGRSPKNSQGVAAFEDAEFLPSDATTFQTEYKLPNAALQVVGPNNGGYFGEAGLDTQRITASARGVASCFLLCCRRSSSTCCASASWCRT